MKKLYIYFHLDEYGRDSIVASALRRYGKRIGCNVQFGNKRTAFITNKLNIFDALIFPSIYHYRLYFPDKSNLPKNVFILPTEAVGTSTGIVRKMQYKYFGSDYIEFSNWHSSINAYLLWGSDHLLGIKSINSKYAEKSFVVGHPRLSKFCIPPQKKKIFEKNTIKQNKAKINIGLVSRFGVANPFDNRSNVQTLFKGMRFKNPNHAHFENTPENIDIEDNFYTELIDMKIFLILMLSLDSDKYQFNLRPYPRENYLVWEKFAKENNINCQVSKWYHPFSYWIRQVDIVISPPSTSFYDLLYQNISPISIDKIISKRKDHLCKESDDNNRILDFICRPKSIDDLISIIKENKSFKAQEGFEGILKSQTAPTLNGDPIQNIFNVIRRRSLINQKQINRRLIYNFHFLFMILWNYMSRIKNPFIKDQGSTAFLTLKKISWINNLSYNVSRGLRLK